MPLISGKNIPNTFWITLTTREKVSEKLTKQLNLTVSQARVVNQFNSLSHCHYRC